MKIGDVVRWNNYPFQKDGPLKARWLICLADPSILDSPALFLLNTTTSKIELYRPGSKRESHKHYLFLKKNFPFFDLDCVLDFKYDQPLPIQQRDLDKHLSDIEHKGVLPAHTLTELFNGMVTAGYTPIKLLQVIYHAMNRNGIKGLKKPK